jgi:ACS family pantothenate transporter-like MFS transporter
MKGEVQSAPPSLSLDTARRVLGKWRYYGCSLLVRVLSLLYLFPVFILVHSKFAISGETEILGSAGIMGQWMKALGGYHVEQLGPFDFRLIFIDWNRYLDYYPSGLTAVAIASTLICATWTDYTKKRWPVLVYMAVSCIIAGIILLIPRSPRGLQFFAFCTAFVGL